MLGPNMHCDSRVTVLKFSRLMRAQDSEKNTARADMVEREAKTAALGSKSPLEREHGHC